MLKIAYEMNSKHRWVLYSSIRNRCNLTKLAPKYLQTPFINRTIDQEQIEHNLWNTIVLLFYTMLISFLSLLFHVFSLFSSPMVAISPAMSE